jgi:hypothetical protein
MTAGIREQKEGNAAVGLLVGGAILIGVMVVVMTN